MAKKNILDKADKVLVDSIAEYITHERFFKTNAKYYAKCFKGGAAGAAGFSLGKGAIDLGGKCIGAAGKFAKKAFKDAKDNVSKVIPFKKPEQQAANS